MKITGKITAWSPRGFGWITARNGTELKRFFVHISKIVSLDADLEEPVEGCPVMSEPTDAFKRSPGDYQSAINVEVGPPRTIAEDVLSKALSGRGGDA